MLINKDCYNEMSQMQDSTIDLIIADPPYEFVVKKPAGGGVLKREGMTTLKKINDKFGMSFDPYLFLEESKRLLKKMNLYVWTNKNLLAEYIMWAKANNYIFDILVWLKPNPIPCYNGHYLPDKEFIVFIRDKGVTFNTDLGFQEYFTYWIQGPGGSYKTTIHPTQKPIEFMKRLIRISSNVNDLVFDPFMGSGTVPRACKELNRRFIGIERDQEYFNEAYNRLNEPVQLTI